MKIGIMSFEDKLTTQTLRGVTTTTKYMKNNLEELGMEVDLLVYSKGKMRYPENFGIARHCKTLEDLNSLKDTYDFIVYFTPGRSWEKFDTNSPDRYKILLDAINVPFTFIYHSEEYETHQPYKKDFVNHHDCKFLIFIVEGLKDIYANDLVVQPRYITLSMIPPLKSITEILELSRFKTPSVIMTSAWTNFKRNMEYFALSSQFNELGLNTYSAGAPNSNYYMNDIIDGLVKEVQLNTTDEIDTCDFNVSRCKDYQAMMSRLNQEIPYPKDKEDSIPHIEGATIYTKDNSSWYDYGAYYPEHLPKILKDKKFHWNMSRYKINKAYIPRIEISTLEALNQGCLPVLCRETTPDWVTEDSAIVLSKEDYAEHLDVLSSMTSDEFRDRIWKFYTLVVSHLYRDKYELLIDKMEEALNE